MIHVVNLLGFIELTQEKSAPRFGGRTSSGYGERPINVLFSASLRFFHRENRKNRDFKTWHHEEIWSVCVQVGFSFITTQDLSVNPRLANSDMVWSWWWPSKLAHKLFSLPSFGLKVSILGKWTLNGVWEIRSELIFPVRGCHDVTPIYTSALPDVWLMVSTFVEHGPGVKKAPSQKTCETETFDRWIKGCCWILVMKLCKHLTYDVRERFLKWLE